MRPFAILLCALLLAQAAFAEAGSPDMRIFCMNLLNISDSQLQPTAQAGQAAPAIQNASNFTFSKGHYDALAELGEANESLSLIRSAGFPYLAARDNYLIAEQWFTGQSALELSGEKGDYRFVTEKAAAIKAQEKDAFFASDELDALAKRIAKTGAEANLTQVLALQSQAKAEFADGRFAESSRLVGSAYDKITEAEAEATRNKALVESTRRTLESFLQENWQKILIAMAALAILFFLFQKQARRFLINAKIRALSAERGVLESMIRGLQKEYFESGKINELSYHIKTKKFGDLIRNINRQLPLLKEELKKL